MQRAVSVQVQAINTDYGYTMLVLRDNFSGEKIGLITLSHEVLYGWDADTSDTHIVHVGINDGNIKIVENRM